MMKNDKTPIYFMIVLLLLLSIFCIIGCSPQYHIKRAIKKDPTILVKDTITHIDTIRIQTNRVEVDSVFMVSNDTTVIIKDNLTIRHFIHNDSVFIFGECDTIFVDHIRKIKVPFETVIINDPFFPRWLYWVFGLIIILFFLNKIKSK